MIGHERPIVRIRVRGRRLGGSSASSQAGKGAGCCLLCLLGLLWWLLPAAVAAQGNQLQSEATFVFGQSVDFELTAATTMPIATVTLFVQPAEAAEARQIEVPFSVADTRAFTASYSLEPAALKPAPFSEISYWWQLESEAGDVSSVPPESFFYYDDRFTWQRANLDMATIYWTGEETAVGEAGIAAVSAVWPSLQKIVPGGAGLPTAIYIYPSSADLRSALRLNGHDWQTGHVSPSLGVVMVTAVNNRTARTDLRHSIPHELTHFLFQQAAERREAEIPFWFEEGVAHWLEEVAEAGAGGAPSGEGWPPLETLCRGAFVPDPAAAAQSQSVVAWLIDQYGERRLADLADAFLAGADCETAVATVFDQSWSEFEAAWRQSLIPQPAWQQFFNQNGLWFLLILGSFVIMGLLLLEPR